ncbi:MAG: YjbQ family protein [Planctomycetota bacterium]
MVWTGEYELRFELITLRAALLGSSFTVPFDNGKLMLGTWQQAVVTDFDNRPRRWNLVIQMIGE